MEYVIPIQNDKYYKAILMILNFQLNMSDLELEIVSTMLSKKIYDITPETRDMICKELSISAFLRNNYIKRLRDKGILLLRDSDKTYTLSPSLIELVKDRKVSFEFDIVA